MRKRIVIALIAVVAIGLGVGGYVLSQPKKGTVEYHKREYSKAHEFSRLHEFALEHGPGALQEYVWQRRFKRIDFHRQALVDLGYLGQKTFIVSNRPPREVYKTLYRIMPYSFKHPVDLVATPVVTKIGGNSLTVVGAGNQMQKWEELIREADVPESGN